MVGILFFFKPLKVYPGQRTGGNEADMMAANELNTHALLQVRKLIPFHILLSSDY